MGCACLAVVARRVGLGVPVVVGAGGELAQWTLGRRGCRGRVLAASAPVAPFPVGDETRCVFSGRTRAAAALGEAGVSAVAGRRAGDGRLLAAIALATVVVAALLLTARPPTSAGEAIVRAAALIGYQCVFLAVMATAYMRRLLHWFGRPFLQVHHLAALLGLGLLVVHPVAAALEWGTAKYLLPQFASVRIFLQYGGAPALYLLVLGASAAVCRGRLGPRWRPLHMLCYPAFVLATIHAFLLGSDFASPVVRVAASAMVAAVLYVGLERHPRPTGRSRRHSRRG